MVQEECDIEGGVAIPRAFAVHHHHSLRRDQDVLRAEVAMSENAPFGPQAGSFGFNDRLQSRMAPGRSQKIRFDAKLLVQ